MTSIRLLFFGLMMVAMVASTVWMKMQGWPNGPKGDGEAWLVPVGILGGLYAVAVVADVISHAWKGEGQTCRACGHVRPVKSFRFAGPCPQCGE
jgi:hypothetical protein